jgi:hypothetical protein
VSAQSRYAEAGHSRFHDHLNFVDRDGDFELLLHRIRGLKGRRENFSLG